MPRAGAVLGLELGLKFGIEIGLRIRLRSRDQNTCGSTRTLKPLQPKGVSCVSMSGLHSIGMTMRYDHAGI